MEELIPKKSKNLSLCPCGSGKYLYALYDVYDNFIMYCCHECETTRRKNLSDMQALYEAGYDVEEIQPHQWRKTCE